MKIYLAIPYTSPSKRTERFRHVIANEVAASLISKGYIIYSPISHTHPIHEACEGTITHSQWLRLDTEFVKWADELWVLTLDGWEESRGVKYEIALAESLQIPVRYLGAADVENISRLD